MKNIIFFGANSVAQICYFAPILHSLEAKYALALNRDMYLAYLCNTISIKVLLYFQEYTNILIVHFIIVFC